MLKQRREVVVLFPVLMLALFLVGCPKAALTTTGTSASAPAVPVASRPDVGLTADGQMRPPALGEFVAAPELRDVHFDFDRYDIRRGDARILDANARWIRANPTMWLLIEGHADERGTNEYNLALGEQRAKATMNYLVAQGIAASRMTLISYGEERPFCTEKNEECWTENRRGHFMVNPR